MCADSVQVLAERWIATKNTARPSPNTVLARQYDLNAVAKLLPAGTMETLPLSEVSLANLEKAFAEYASTHAASSTSRVMSTWKKFCLWLVREKLIEANPMDMIEGPKNSMVTKAAAAGRLERCRCDFKSNCANQSQSVA